MAVVNLCYLLLIHGPPAKIIRSIIQLGHCILTHPVILYICVFGTMLQDKSQVVQICNNKLLVMNMKFVFPV